MLGSVVYDSDGIESIARPPIKEGFVQVDNSGQEYELSDSPADQYARVQRIHAICTDPTGSVGGAWDLYDALAAQGGVLIISLPQPILAANLAVGKEIVFEFQTPLSSKVSEDLAIKPSANLGKWKIAAFGYYTKVVQR
jgi:hypothetical protein